MTLDPAGEEEMPKSETAHLTSAVPTRTFPPALPEASDIAAVIACLGDDAAQIRQEVQEADVNPTAITIVAEEWADNMEAAAKLLQQLADALSLPLPLP